MISAQTTGKSRSVVLLCFLVFLFSSFGSTLTQGAILELSGTASYQISDDETAVVLRVDELANNSSSGLSGTIRLELWAFSQPYAGVGGGYKLASYQMEQLLAGAFYYDISSGLVYFELPPPGTWYFSLLAREFTGASGDGFVTRDYMNFASSVRVAGGAYAEDVKIIGPTQWTVYNNSVQLKVEELINICDLGTTGTLRLDLWATGSQYNGGAMTGYRFGTVTLDHLHAGYAYNDINQFLTYYRPPDGYYYVTLTLSEYNGGQYRIVDYVKYPALKTFGNPPPPVPASPSSLTATKGTLTTGIRLNWTSSTWATTYEVYRSTGNNSSSGALLAGNLTGTVYLDTSAVVGTTYYYWVKAKNISGRSGFSPGAWGSRNGIAPSIATQPKNQNKLLGQSVTFSVSASGTAPMSYQWRKDGSDLPGATRTSLTLLNLQPTDAASYSVRIVNSYGEATSNNAQLGVYDPATLKVLYWQASDRRLALWYMDGVNLVTSTPVRNGLPVPNGWNLRGFGDFNNDSKIDLLFQHQDGRMTTWLMDGSELLGITHLPTPGLSWRATGVAYMNQDSTPDILLRHIDGRLSVWYMNGTEFSSSVLLKEGQPVNVNWRLAGTGDFNADNHIDLLWHNKDGRSHVWLMNGIELASTIPLRNGIATPAGVRLAAVLDLDNNNHPDIIWQTPDRHITSWLMQETEVIQGLRLNSGKPVGLGWNLVGPK